MSTSIQRRRRLLAAVYGEEATDDISRRLEDLVGKHRGSRSAIDTVPWSERSVWLITYADTFPDPDRGSPLAALDQFIDDHLSEHVDGVHILPFAPWSSDGGFSVIDYEAVDSQYGTWDDIEALTAKRTVMFDAVINHMSAESPWFHSFLAGDPPFAHFFRTSDPSLDTSSVVRPRTHPLLTPFTRPDGSVVHVWTTFSTDQVDLDYANPEVLLRIIEVLAEYCDRGARAIRLDAIGFLWKDEATSSIHLPETHRLIQLMRSCVDEISPGTLLISETNVPHRENVSYLGEPGATPEVHAVYQFPLAPLLAHAALTGETTVLERWAEGIDDIVGPGRSFLNFLACHDGVGVRPAEGLLDADQLQILIDACRSAGGFVSERSLPDGGTAPYELNTTWFDLMSAGLDEGASIERHLATYAVMLALPGIAAIYSHSMFGASNDVAAVERSHHPRDINRTRFTDRTALEADIGTPGTRANRVYEGLARLIARRRSTPAFHPEGSMTVLDSPPGVFALERHNGEHRARVIVNLGPDTSDVEQLATGWVDLLDATTAPSLLEPRESLWLRPGG